ncbi:putative transcriptional regulator, LysR family [Cupriavidus taiwanensis]|uniref:Transcriptional regulator, LysR family n=1 Tax=Cupriavidus taiwanensis TaxID=164546 RepID=A0A976AY51_9BURK|nr:LysR family transcriptional regulator [Cupriavidus taiwanensis]SOZ59432.1 putative transcriptional regulator, LysR family [Cupriavidus taiwanensis]SOZ59980.1 putative transcriptional regulator, LysR family [Cupriavidus taiwanensis]SOZ63047.1 putative transcriptional regulator, LysR family [Cupriavidus taiwanensis]SPA06452.1 putative transcriptional regulator, LysR family [Cupriavidus taiwanensis]
MGLRQLHHFVTLVEQGSFARAAAALHLSQPALTRSIQALESELGTLIDRSYGKVRPTAAGTLALARARRMLREQRELRRDLQLLEDAAIGTIRAGFGPFAASFLLDPVLEALVRRYPRLRIDVESADTSSMRRSLEAEQLDIFVGESRSLAELAHLQIDRLPPLETAFFVRSGHPLTRQHEVTLAALRGYPVAGPRLPPHIVRFFRQALHEASSGTGPLPEDEPGLMTVTCNDMHALRSLLLAVDAVALVPVAMMADACARHLAVALPMHPPTALKAQYGIVALAGRTPSPAMRVFAALVHETVAQISADAGPPP